MTLTGEIESLKGKDFLTLADWSQATILDLLAKAAKGKAAHLAGEVYTPLKGKILGMIFEKSSTRTRVSFEAGMLQLGGHALYLNKNDLQLGRGETVADTAQILSQYVDAIMIRTFEHAKIEELAKYATIPVINGLTDSFHPCQALADLLTIQEVKGGFKGLKLAYIGDGNNMAHSLLIAATKVGMDIAIAVAPGYEPDAEVVKLAQNFAEASGSSVTITNDPVATIKDADVIYSDVWTSMGQESENKVRLQAFHEYQVNEELVQYANDDYIFLHCLPAHRGEEVSPEIIDGDHSYVFQQAGNRLHAQKALLVEILG
ncbi:ornithine carbamoyltransferase [Bacillaceae bacterium Marseille-Q3522]|nr:ornithine carbamoyltransferase [Bacillaceae bacterium Marseille-Q3522]